MFSRVLTSRRALWWTFGALLLATAFVVNYAFPFGRKTNIGRSLAELGYSGSESEFEFGWDACRFQRPKDVYPLLGVQLKFMSGRLQECRPGKVDFTDSIDVYKGTVQGGSFAGNVKTFLERDSRDWRVTSAENSFVVPSGPFSGTARLKEGRHTWFYTEIYKIRDGMIVDSEFYQFDPYVVALGVAGLCCD